MAFFDLVKFSTATAAGTGDITVGSAAASYFTPSDAGVPDGWSGSIAIRDGVNAEVSTGVYDAETQTFARTVQISTNNNDPIDMSSDAVVYFDVSAADLNGFQPLDSDLTAIAALTTTAYGRALLTAASGSDIKPTESFVAACGDETSAITAGTGKVSFRMPYAFTVTEVYASLVTAQTSGSIFTVDINEAGTSILSTKLTIDNTETDSDTAATAAVISDASIARRAVITVDVDQIGDGTAKGLKVTLVGHRT